MTPLSFLRPQTLSGLQFVEEDRVGDFRRIAWTPLQSELHFKLRDVERALAIDACYQTFLQTKITESEVLYFEDWLVKHAFVLGNPHFDYRLSLGKIYNDHAKEMDLFFKRVSSLTIPLTPRSHFRNKPIRVAVVTTHGADGYFLRISQQLRKVLLAQGLKAKAFDALSEEKQRDPYYAFNGQSLLESEIYEKLQKDEITQEEAHEHWKNAGIARLYVPDTTMADLRARVREFRPDYILSLRGHKSEDLQLSYTLNVPMGIINPEPAVEDEINRMGSFLVQVLTIEKAVDSFVDGINAHHARVLVSSSMPPPIDLTRINPVFKPLKMISGEVVNWLPGFNQAVHLRDSNGREWHWKVPKSGINLGEITCSRLASYLTGGLVPIVRPGKREGVIGLYQKFLKLDTAPFSDLDKTRETDFSFLDDRQKHQLFVHIIVDRLISNWDTNPYQYGIDERGNVISFDKGNAFYNEFDLDGMKAEPIYDLALTNDYSEWLTHPDPLQRGFPVASTFVKAIQERQFISPDHADVQDFFNRCESMTREQVKMYLSPFAAELYPERSDEFIDFVCNRIRTIRREVYAYFDWSFLGE